jgi:hypothetical protein
MGWILPLLTAFHVVPGVFWAGSTFVLARLRGTMAEQLAPAQGGAALVTMIAGAGLWWFAHGEAFGRYEQILGLGAVCAIAAAAVQGGIGVKAIRRLRGADEAEKANLRRRIALTQRFAAGLLVVTIICMVTARYL